MSRLMDIEQLLKNNIKENQSCIFHVDMQREILKRLENAEERPTGKWMTTDMKGIYRCSNCRMLSYLRSYNYCQNCGSKMEVYE